MPAAFRMVRRASLSSVGVKPRVILSSHRLCKGIDDSAGCALPW
jgi:hypothetical protein